MQSSCFANLNLFLFCRSRCRRRSRCLISLVSIALSLRGSQSDHVDALMFSGGIPNVVAAGKAVLKDWNRSVLTHLMPTINFFSQQDCSINCIKSITGNEKEMINK